MTIDGINEGPFDPYWPSAVVPEAGSAAEKRELNAHGLAISVREYWSRSPGGMYHSVRIVFLSDQSELVFPIEMSTSGDYWATVDGLMGTKGLFLQRNWRDREKHIKSVDVASVSRKKDLHLCGEFPKPPKKPRKKKAEQQ